MLVIQNNISIVCLDKRKRAREKEREKYVDFVIVSSGHLLHTYHIHNYYTNNLYVFVCM